MEEWGTGEEREGKQAAAWCRVTSWAYHDTMPANHPHIIYYSIFACRTFALAISGDSVALQFESI